MNDHEKNIAYDLVSTLLQAINRKDMNILKVNFQISAAMLEEIEEELDRYSDDHIELAPPPRSIAFVEGSGGREPFALFDRDGEADDDAKVWGIECQLWNGEEKTELTLLADVKKFAADEFRLQYRLIEVQ